MQIVSISIGFSEVPDLITLNLYATGCKHDCKGCHSPELKDFNHPNSQEFTSSLLHKKLKDNFGLIQGICWLGGDSMFQRESYIELGKIINKHPLYNILYTGFTFDELPEEVKEVTDVIVDGKFEGIPVTEEGTNQKCYCKQDNGEWVAVPFKVINKYLRSI